MLQILGTRLKSCIQIHFHKNQLKNKIIRHIKRHRILFYPSIYHITARFMFRIYIFTILSLNSTVRYINGSSCIENDNVLFFLNFIFVIRGF